MEMDQRRIAKVRVEPEEEAELDVAHGHVDKGAR
jgi:hypothetical protein